MRCIACGSENEDEVKYCKKCGNPISEQKENGLTSQAQESGSAATAVDPPTGKIKDRAEQPAFVLGICAAALTIIPIPLISWFALPAALIGFILAASMWLKAKNEQAIISNRGLAAIILNGFVVVNHLFGVIGVKAATSESIYAIFNALSSYL